MSIFFSSPADRNGFPTNQVVDCICALPIVPDDPISDLEHTLQHREFDRVTRATGRVPVSIPEREDMRSRGREARRAGRTLAERIAGAELELRGYFERSYSESIQRGFGDLHPSLDAYVRFAADIDMLADPAVSAALREKNELVSRPGGTIVATCWEPCGTAEGEAPSRASKKGDVPTHVSPGLPHRSDSTYRPRR